MAMLEPAWMKGSSLSQVLAVLKRTNILTITSNTLYYRRATEEEVCVQGVLLNESKFLLCQSGGVKYMAYRKGNRDVPEDLAKHLKWEEAWMRSVMENKGAFKPPMPVEISTSPPFSEKTTVTLSGCSFRR